jgi:hypothetical protein
MQNSALQRAVSGQSFTNYPAIYEGFAAKGLTESDIAPRVNIFTYRAWIEKGRQVRRGEHGVKVITFIEKKDKTGRIQKMPRRATVFHVSQTDSI